MTIEVLKGSGEQWVAACLDRADHLCEGCGGEDRVKVVLVIPEAAGGKKLASNGMVICRTCELAADRSRRSRHPASGEETRPINFWISRKLYSRLRNGLSTKYGFRSMASLVRYLMGKYVGDSDRFDDVAQYQESGADVKINVWVPRDMYASFKEETGSRNLTVTDTLKGLIRMYEMEIDRVVDAREIKDEY